MPKTLQIKHLSFSYCTYLHNSFHAVCQQLWCGASFSHASFELWTPSTWLGVWQINKDPSVCILSPYIGEHDLNLQYHSWGNETFQCATGSCQSKHFMIFTKPWNRMLTNIVHLNNVKLNTIFFIYMKNKANDNWKVHTIWVFPFVITPKTSCNVVFVFRETAATLVPTYKKEHNKNNDRDTRFRSNFDGKNY